MLDTQSLDAMAPEIQESGAFRQVRTWSKEQFALQKERAVLWLPVHMALGIGLYFALPVEPPLAGGLLAWVILLALLTTLHPYRLGQKGGKLYTALILLILPATGFTAAQLRTHLVYTPIIAHKIGPVTVTGTVESIERLPGKKGNRILLSDISVENLEAQDTPRKVRLQARQNSDFFVGQKVKVLAQLTPPSAPVYPGGYDFRRAFYFQGIGAVGFIYRIQDVLETPAGYGWNIEILRQAAARTIWGELPADQAAIVSALTIGQQKGISEKNEDAMRNAGLAHLLAISGLNISLVAGLIFFFTRLCMATSPVLALNCPIKKIAALISFVGAVFYMLLAGAEIPVQRAVLMTGIVILAILMDRTPISLRLVAFSATVILILSPESLISASFQMSFAAVLALVSFYEGTAKFWVRAYSQAGPFQRIALYFLGVCLSSLVASTATAPFAAYHFQRFPVYGLLANLVAVPLMGFLIMPAGLVAFLLMPFGLSYWPLQVMALGVSWTVDVAAWTASLPGAVIDLKAWPFLSFLFCIAAGLLLCLWKGNGKLIALIFAALAWITLGAQTPPDILVSETGKLVAYKVPAETMYASTKRSEKFVLKNWERQAGLPEGASLAFPRATSEEQKTDGSAPLCDAQACRAFLKGKKISIIFDPYAFAIECAWADIIIAREPLSQKNCRAAIQIDRFTLWREGALALWINERNGSVWMKGVTAQTGNRPWSIWHPEKKKK
ncbi:MAG: ComEC family competence protein [Alphaproteobacteria bacterium]|nr:ComEC family competence protein [Alphaproteobacteria bacterium]